MYCLPIDLETSLHNQGDDAVGKFDADPISPKNWIVWGGWQVLDDKLNPVRDIPVTRRFKSAEEVAIPAPYLDAGQCIVVAHNAPYDILFLCNPNNKYWQDWVEWLHDPRAKVWDTMTVEYRLRGQLDTQPSLDHCCEARGWPVKPGRMKEYWKQGVSTEDIPDDEVQPYLVHDVTSLVMLFRDQVAEVQRRGMMNVVRIENDAILATTAMRWIGMHFDAESARAKYRDEIQGKLTGLTEELVDLLHGLTGIPKEHINPMSNPFLNKVLYGGVAVWKEKEVAYVPNPENPWECIEKRYKSGKKKGQVVQQNVTKEAILPPRVTVPTDRKGNPLWEGVGEDALDNIVAHKCYTEDVAEVFSKVIELRKFSKLATTYYVGYSQLTWHHDSCLHGNLNHSVAVTTRLSSSAPNLQNASHNEIREYFRSRYEGGEVAEADLSQIEVVVQGFLTQDEQLCADIRAGMDFHSKRAAFVHSAVYEEVRAAVKAEDPVWQKRRSDAKAFSFQRSYGAGAVTIAADTGMELSVVQAFIEAEDAMYPGVSETQHEWLEEANHSLAPHDGIVCGVLKSPTGTEYRFQRSPDFRGKMSIKPTIVKNYPIQGLAADLIKIILSNLRKLMHRINAERALQHLDPILLVNTVHDSVIFDMPPGVDHQEFAREVIHLMTEGTRETLRTRFGIDFNLPIRADMSVGKCWTKKAMHEIKLAA